MAQAPEQRPRWRAWPLRYRFALAFVGYVVLAALFVHDWDGYVFATTVRDFWHGHSPYAVAAKDPWYGYLNVADEHVQWYAYPPLPLLAMAVSFAPSVFLDLPPPVDRVLLKLPVLLGTLGLAAVAGAWTRRMGGSEEDVAHIERRFLTNPFLILVGPVWGMTDTALMALFMGGLLALAHDRPRLGGVLVALSVLVKPFPLLIMLPLVPYYVRRDGWRRLMEFAAACAVTALAICLPFFLASPGGFWRQAVGGHLARDPQGLSVWSLWPLDQLSATSIEVASLTVMAVALLAIGWAATRLNGRGTTLVLMLAGAIAVLVTNRVVNEQYLVLVVAPMLVLDKAHRLDRFAHLVTHVAPTMFALAIVLVGYHFLTFIPPDIALRVLHVPTDLAAFYVRRAAPEFWQAVQTTLAIAVPITILLLGVVAARLMRSSVASAPAATPSSRRSLAPTAAACFALFLLALVPVLQTGTAAATDDFVPARPGPAVTAFYYLWWQNPAHDPGVRYGNWEVVSQVPTMGYYTNTRGVAREHSRMMVDAGIDTAIVSYHRGELERYRVFQEEAAKAGLYTLPLIELNQVYDQVEHHPINSTGDQVRHAAYRLDKGTEDAIAGFVLDLRHQLAEPSTARIDGKPVVMFYDSYVSALSYWPEDRIRLAEVLLTTNSLSTLRTWFNDPTMNGTVEDALKHYPPTNDDFYRQGSAALWRRAHLEEHRQFWAALRERLDAEVGPLHLISGDALNERAGFEFGTVKLLVNLEVFDGSFIYSPSFTWGNQPKAPFNDTFALWEDRNHWLTSYARTRDATSSFGIAPAYDDTVNRKHGFIIPAYPNVTDRTFYDLSWDSALAEPPTLPAVATFNEFFEGSSIEPSREFGDRFLADTLAARARFDKPEERPWRVAVIGHERSSRTSLYYAETDLSHFWGLDLLAAAPRAVPGAEITAIDALEPRLEVPVKPDLLLVEGGRGQFEVSADVLGHLFQWAGSGGIPQVVFGSDVATALNPVLGDNCLAGLDAVPDPPTLVPGDRLVGGAGTLTLHRGGRAYHVGDACDPGLHAGSAIKPWVATDPIHQPWGGAYDRLNRACLEVTLRALMPAFAAPGAPTECAVPG